MIERLRAPAKLTLTLRITGVRSDGYHLIDAEMVTLELADEVIIDPSRTGLRASGPFAAGMPVDETNLVAKALRWCGREASVDIVKNIPHGGGLGGGSADAAAVLRWAGVDDVAATAVLGADVPFCLRGGRARVRGIGEIVEPLDESVEPITLIVPPLRCSTPAVYRAWDDLGGPHARGGNDLEDAAIAVTPPLAGWRDRIREAAGVAPTLAGSGATWFLRGHHAALDGALDDALVLSTHTTA